VSARDIVLKVKAKGINFHFRAATHVGRIYFTKNFYLP